MDTSSDNIIFTDDLPYTPEPGGLGKTFFTKMKSYGDAIAQMDGYNGHVDSYSSLLKRCICTAIGMRRMGISQGDIISICSYNHFDSAAPFIGSFFIGAVSANIDPQLSITDTVRLLKMVQPKQIFTGFESVGLIESSLKECSFQTTIVVFGKSEKHLEFSKFLENHEEEEEDNFLPVEVDLKCTAIICFSSGTSGLPKGISLSHFQILCQAIRCRDIGYNLQGFLGFSSFYWSTGIYIVSSCIMHKGYKIIVPTFDLNTIWDVFSKVKVRSMMIPTYHVTMMCSRGKPKNMITNLEYLGVNGSYMSVKLASDLRKLFPETKLVAGYGLTEVFGYCICFKPNCLTDQELFRDKPASDGKAIEGFTLKVVNPETEETLGPNQIGELRIKSNLQMNGYYNMESTTAWDSDGWLKTGDLVYYDKDKCFYVVDRLKEIMRVQYWTVLPALIEEILTSYPSVETAVVVGKPHPTDGEHPVGLVVLKQTATNEVTPEDIEKYVEERVDESKKLRGGVKIVQSLPITPTGKINRSLIKKMIVEGII